MTGGKLKLSTFLRSSSSGWMYNSGPVEQRGFLGLRGGILQFDSTLDQFPGETSAHSEEQDFQRECQDPSPEAALQYNAHVTCQGRHSRNVLTKALRNIHCHCSTGFMKSEVLCLRHSLQKTIYPYKDLEKPKQKSR